MAKETINGVANFYGPRHRHEGVVGQMKTEGALKELVIHFGGDNYTTVTGVLPKGALVREVLAEVNEVFDLGGTTPVILVGASGTESTNYAISLSEAQAEALGTYAGTPAGTLAAVLAAAVTLKVALGGGSPTITSAGRAKVVIRYMTI